MRAEPIRGSSLRPAPKWLFFALIIVVTAMVAVALLSEAFSSGGSTIYLAQIAPGSSQPGVTEPSIVVIGYGTASAPADSATLQLLLASGSPYENPDPIRPTPGATPGAAESEAAAPVVVALTANGVLSGQIRVIVSPALWNAFYGPSENFVVRLDFTVANPQLDQLTRIVNAAGQAANENGMTMTQVGVAFSISDCEALVGQARERATDDARARARQQAEALGLPLGKLLLSSEVPGPFPGASAGCAPSPDTPSTASLGTAAVGITVPPFDPAAPPEATAFVRVSLAFAIPDEGNADD